MNWIADENTFRRAYDQALVCAATDSGRLPTSLKKLTFNDVDILSDAFPCLIQTLLEWSGDDGCEFVVLRPDPVYYFRHFFGRYPVIEIKRGMNVSDYLVALNEWPPESRADALGVIYSEYVFAPSSLRWFIHALRSVEDDGGHLWVPAEWIDKIAEVYPIRVPLFRSDRGRSTRFPI
ncbi:MAG: hypothetical protein ACHQKY_17725, partial [Terriglobia bacterium]